jgi:hypothetical protein
MSGCASLFDDAARQRLARLLGMLGSSHDGEATNAGRLADKLVKSLGMTWQDVIAPPALASPARQKATRQAPDWPSVAQRVLDCGEASAWETAFCENLLARWRGRRLTEKQAQTLGRIWVERCGGEL